MNKYTYYIVDSEGYVLLTVVSQNTNRSFDVEAKVSATTTKVPRYRWQDFGRVGGHDNHGCSLAARSKGKGKLTAGAGPTQQAGTAQQLESGQHDAIARPMVFFMHSAPYLKSISLLCEATGPLNPPVVYGVGDPFHDEGLELLCNCPSADTTALLCLESGFCDRDSGSFGDL